MHLNQAVTLGLMSAGLSQAQPAISSRDGQPSCRFATQYTQRQVLSNPKHFINDMLYWEGKFHQNNVSYNTGNGMSYDGTEIDWTTGERTAKHPFSAASKEVSSHCHFLSYCSAMLILDSRFKSCCILMLLLAPAKLHGSFLLMIPLRPRPLLPRLWTPSCKLI